MEMLPAESKIAPILETLHTLEDFLFAPGRQVDETLRGLVDELRESIAGLDRPKEEAGAEDSARDYFLGQLQAATEPQRIVTDLCTQVMARLDCQAFFNFIVDETGKHLRLNAYAGIPAEEAARIKWLDLGTAVCGTVARDGQRLVAEDIQHTSDPRAELVRTYGIQVYACHPLLANGRVIGTLSFGARTRPHFTADELAIMKAASEQVAVVMDRYRTAEALRASDQRFRLALKNAPVSVAAQDQELRFIWAYNQRTVRPADVIGKTDADVFPPETAARLVSLKRKVLETGEEVSEKIWVESGGHRLFLDLFLEPIRDEAGRITGVGIATVDLTEQKLAEEALRASEHRFRSVLEYSLDAAYRRNLQTDRYDYMSPVFEQITGRTVEEMTHADIDTVLGWIHPDDLASVEAEIARTMAESQAAGRSTGDLEYRFLCKDGQYRWVADKIYVLADEAGQPHYRGGTFRDIHQHKLAEEALKRSELRYRSLFEGMTEGFAIHEIILDEAGRPCDYRFLDINPSFERYTGLKRADVVGQLKSVVLPNDDPHWLEIYGGVALTGEPVHFENHSSALNRDYEVFAFRPAERQFAVIFMEITERKRIQRELSEANRRLQSVLDTITDAYYVLDADWRVVELNPVAEAKIFLRPAGEVLGKSLWEIIPEASNSYLYTQYRRAVGEGCPVHFEMHSPAQDAWFEIHLYPREGRLEVYLRDISKRKQAEELAENLARFPQQNPSPTLRVRQDGVLLFANPASQSVLLEWGCRAGQPVPLFIHHAVTEALSRQKTLKIDIPSGDQVFSFLMVPIVETGYVNLYGRDVTELVKTTRDLQRARDELEASVQTRTAELQKANELLQVEIAERKRAQESLRQANAYNRELIEASLDPLVTITPDGKISDVNTATEMVTGYSRQELVGTDFHRYFTDPEKARSGYQQAFETGTVRDLELSIRQRDGHITDVLYNATVYHDENEQVTGVFAAARDITQRKQVEEQLRLQTKALEAAANGIIITDQNGSIEWVNAAFTQMTGFTAGDVLGQNPRMFQSGQHDQAFYQQMWSTILAGRVWRGEITNRRKNGSLYDEEQTISPVLGQGGQITHFIAIKQDISDRKHAEALAREDARRSDVLSETSRLLSEAGPNYGKALPAIVRLLGEALGDLCLLRLFSDDGKSLQTASFHSSDQDISPRILEAISSDLAPGEGLTGVVIRSGAPLNISPENLKDVIPTIGLKLAGPAEIHRLKGLLILPLRAQDQSLGILAIARTRQPQPFTLVDQTFMQNLAERIALAIVNARLYASLEKALDNEQSLRAQMIQYEKYSAIGRMVASIAHELNNPLQSIRNCLYLTRQDLPAEASKIYLDMADSEIQRLSMLVSQLREVYRPRPLEPRERVDLLEILAQVKILVAHKLLDARVTWMQGSLEGRFLVSGVPDHIKQVFLNISLNAIEAMAPQGGQLTISGTRSAAGDQVGIIFQDTGPGIDPENLSRLFEPLFTTKQSGLGLGLSISYDIVRAHGGQILVQSQIGNGSTFTVWLPAAGEKQLQQEG